MDRRPDDGGLWEEQTSSARGSTGSEIHEVVFVVAGLVPNRKSHPPVYRWMASIFLGKCWKGCALFEQIRERVRLGSRASRTEG